MPKVSIVVPIYNTEKYLAQCIDSILAQTFTDFELILVNDGSTDKSAKICDEYAKKDSRIVVIHKENGGANKARETGVNVSNGEWINFVDSDDTITKDALEKLLFYSSSKYDIIIGQIENIQYKPGIYPIDKYRLQLLRGRYPSPVSKLIKSSLFTEITFNTPREILVGEDHLMNIRLSFATEKKVRIIPTQIYKYNIRYNSTFHSHNHAYDYSEKFFIEYLKSVPNTMRTKYSDSIFYFAYNEWSNFCGYKVFIPKYWQCYNITKYVKENYVVKRHQLYKFDNILIKYNNIFIRVIFIGLKKIKNRLNI